MHAARTTGAVATLLLVMRTAGPEAQSARGRRWSKLGDLAPGTRVHVTTETASFPALVVVAEPALLTVVDLSKVHAESVRTGFATQVPKRRTQLVTGGRRADQLSLQDELAERLERRFEVAHSHVAAQVSNGHAIAASARQSCWSSKGLRPKGVRVAVSRNAVL